MTQSFPTPWIKGDHYIAMLSKCMYISWHKHFIDSIPLVEPMLEPSSNIFTLKVIKEYESI